MKKTLLVVLVIVVVVLVALWISGVAKNPITSGPVASPTPNPNRTPATIVQPSGSVLPSGFPSDIPIEVGATITQNYSTTNPLGQPIAVREFVSKSSMAANLTLYKTSLAASGWTITNTVDASDQKIIDATKGNNNVRVRIYTNAGKVTVTIQVTTTK